MSSIIRPVNIQDIDAIMEIERRSFPVAWEYSTFQRISSQNGRVVSSDSRMLIMDILEHNQKLTGYAVWETNMMNKTGHVLNLAVTSEERRNGFGRLLLNHVHESLILDGMTSIFLEVRDSNTPARKLYESSGYTASGRLVGYYYDEDAILYSRSI
ncbi:MAG: ribosomal protein S18-alanine N-acetyltransferase [Candidatus Thorarchaeota archaeon]|jgi:ribosomal-protein-alanine N-acetyltransferase